MVTTRRAGPQPATRQPQAAPRAAPQARTVAAAPAGPRVAMRAPQHTAPQTERLPAREPEHTRVRTRQRHSAINDDPFYIPIEEIPEGSSYEWKRHTVGGLEDPFYIAQMRTQGWEPVNPKAHPNWVPPGYTLPYIIKGGQILMERPMELTQEAITEMKNLTRNRMREAEQRLGLTPRDTMTRAHPDVKPRVSKEVMRPIPIEE